MSHKPTEITNEIYSYLINNFSAEDSLLRELRADATANNIPEICIAPEQGKFMQFYLKSINAKYVLEIGTLAGYSAIIMGRALPEDGKLITVEIFEKNATFARKWIEKAGLSNKVEVVNSPGVDFFKNFKPEYELDFVFIDADKKNYRKYLELSYPHLRKGGVVCADNALAFGKIAEADPTSEPGNVKAIQQYNQELIADPRFFNGFVTMGDGMAMGIKL